MAIDFMESLAIQSWCFRGFKTHDEVIGALGECGVSRIELSHAHYKPWEAADQQEIVDYYRQRGVAISCYGALNITGDEEKARTVFDLAKVAGFDTIVVLLGEGGLETAEKLCPEYGKRIAVHNHGRHDPDGAVWRIEEILGNSSDNIGLCLDTAWMIDSGGDPIEVAEKFAARLYGVHIKDFVFDRAGKHSDVIVGTGNLDLPAFLEVLRKNAFSGFFTLEYEGDVNDPVPATKQCVEAIRQAVEKL